MRQFPESKVKFIDLYSALAVARDLVAGQV